MAIPHVGRWGQWVTGRTRVRSRRRFPQNDYKSGCGWKGLRVGGRRGSLRKGRGKLTVSTGVLMEAPRSGRDAPRGFPELDLGEGAVWDTGSGPRAAEEGNSKLGLAETGGSEGDSVSDWGNGGILTSWNVRGTGGLTPTRPRRLGIS